jgi:hypothetical protein
MSSSKPQFGSTESVTLVTPIVLLNKSLSLVGSLWASAMWHRWDREPLLRNLVLAVVEILSSIVCASTPMLRSITVHLLRACSIVLGAVAVVASDITHWESGQLGRRWFWEVFHLLCPAGCWGANTGCWYCTFGLIPYTGCPC